ncbi:hypothetical protein [Thiomicrorhabdus indica]|uniref:hypothetical protein n=1 Tax=Thiomicrorhabdus indica TaxID=2267253 RepID=UPI00102DFDE7|nr:hypothetical protein [Thiomicrorhabdus indica]
MNQEQKTFLARTVEITAFGQFGAFGYPALLKNDWIIVAITCLAVLVLLATTYAILSINTGD